MKKGEGERLGEEARRKEGGRESSRRKQMKQWVYA